VPYITRPSASRRLYALKHKFSPVAVGINGHANGTLSCPSVCGLSVLWLNGTYYQKTV